MTKKEIVERLKVLWGVDSDAKLGEELGVGRQGIYQWQNGKRQSDITTEIMQRLINQVEDSKRH